MGSTSERHVAQPKVVIIEQGFALHGPHVAGAEVELFQIDAVAIHDGRHELVKPHKVAQVFPEDVQRVLFLLAFLQTFLGIR